MLAGRAVTEGEQFGNRRSLGTECTRVQHTLTDTVLELVVESRPRFESSVVWSYEFGRLETPVIHYIITYFWTIMEEHNASWDQKAVAKRNELARGQRSRRLA